MGIGTTVGVIGGGLAGAGIGAGASLSAAGTQASAADQAAQLQAQEAQNALEFQKQQWTTQQQNLAPWLKAGTGAINTLSDLMKNGGFPSWDQIFQAPTIEQARNEPGYEFQKQQGEEAVQNSAAARGGLLSGNTLTAEQEYGQGLADTNYQNVYNRALQQYRQQYNIFQQNQANRFNRLSTLAGGGQVAANTLDSLGQSAAGNVANISLTAGAQQGQDIQNAAAATASGYVGAGNAFGGAFNNIGQSLLLSQLMQGGGGIGGPPQVDPYANPAALNIPT